MDTNLIETDQAGIYVCTYITTSTSQAVRLVSMFKLVRDADRLWHGQVNQISEVDHHYTYIIKQ